MSPQLLANKPYMGSEADMFALALILLECKVGMEKFFRAASATNDLYIEFINENKKLWSRYPEEISEHFKDLTNRMLFPIEDKRLTDV